MADFPGTNNPDTLDGGVDGDSITGLNGNDLLSGNGGADSVYGGGGDDSIYGGDDDDRIYGSGGNDYLSSSTGPSDDVDSLYGGAGSDVLDLTGQLPVGGSLASCGDGDDTASTFISFDDTLYGGGGNDLLIADAGSNVLYFIVDMTNGRVDDGSLSKITGFERYEVYGDRFADIASFDIGNDFFRGYAGNDTAFGQGGFDTLYGDSGADSLDGGDGNDSVYGGSQDDLLLGMAGNDYLVGGSGADVVYAGAGADRIILQQGNDTVTGGSGTDRFMFNETVSGQHLIMDFDGSADSLEFNAGLLQSGAPSGALDPSQFNIGTAVGSQAQFVLRYDAAEDLTYLDWDVNGDDPSGAVLALAVFDGNVTVQADDILIT